MQIKVDGMKTYVVGIALICYAVGGFVAGKVDATSGIEAILIALGLMGLRHGITKKMLIAS